VFVLSCALILCVPRFYKCTVKLAPEMSSLSSSSLTDIASSFGIEIGSSSNGGDAIFPELYPDLMASTDFITNLFDVRIKTMKDNVDTTYYEYLLHHQKSAWWDKIFKSVTNFFAEKDSFNNGGRVDPFRLTRQQNGIVKKIGKNIMCDVDKKNYVISITVKDQDPMVCALMADTVRMHLQSFITDYRTKKAAIDLAYIENLFLEAKENYEKSRIAYGAYSDANQDITLTSYRLIRDNLENEMQLQYNNYSALSTQLQSAKAKLQEKTPAFTTLQSATVPVKPAGPKRMIFVLSMLFLTFVIDTLYAAIKTDKNTV